MNAAISQDENRRSRRLPGGDPSHGELELADHSHWPVTIVDQSAGGFGLLTDELPPTACGDIVKLHTDSQICEARIIHMTTNEPSVTIGSPSTSRYRLGLVRLRDIPLNPDGDEHDAQRVRFRLPSCDARLSPIAAFAVLLGIVVVGGIVISEVVLNTSAQDSKVSSRAGANDSTRGLSDQASTQAKNAPTAPSHRNAEMDSERFDLKHLPGALPFVMNSVVRELALSDTQLEQIRHIIDDTDQAIATNEQSRLLMDNARKEALRVLTDPQRRRWAALSGGNTASTGQGVTTVSHAP